MKAIYTFWSKPFNSTGTRAFAGFLDEEMFYCSWILAVMTASKYFDEIVLYTDAKGAIMLSKLNLPFDSVHIILDKMNHLPVDLWAVPKLLVYSLQNEPYIHMDYDIYWWTKPPIEILHNPYICEYRVSTSTHKALIADVVANAEYVPDYILKANTIPDSKVCVPGAGIYGGQHPLDIAKTALAGLDMVSKNTKYITKLAESKDKDVSLHFLNNVIEEIIPGMILDVDWTVMQHLPKAKECYGHMGGNSKKMLQDCTNIKNLVKQEYPQYYNRL